MTKSASFMNELKKIIKEDMKEHQRTRVSYEEFLKVTVESSHTPFEPRPSKAKPVEIYFKRDLAVRLTNPNPQRLPLEGPVLISRATRVIDVQSTSALYKDKNLVVKLSWIEADRTNEKDIINLATEKLQKSNSNLVDYLPKLFGSMDIPLSDTGHIKRLLNLKAAEGTISRRRRPRILRLLLYQRLEPLEEITAEKQFTEAWIDCFKCHFALRKIGIQHCDISVWNLMWDNVKSCGVLNDFDRAVIGHSGKRGPEPTGTLPFMARDLLDPLYYENNLMRLYSHEVESFIWVLVWLTLRPLSELPSSQEWRFSSDRDVVLGSKTSFVRASVTYPFFDRLADSTNFKYAHTWKKCQTLLELLNKFNRLERDGIKVNETVAQKIHDEV